MTRNRASMEVNPSGLIEDLFGSQGLKKKGELNEIYSLTGQTGSLAYMAPEVYLKKDYNHKVDVFSFAVVAFEALTRVHPYIHWMLHSKSFGKAQGYAALSDQPDWYLQIASRRN